MTEIDLTEKIMQENNIKNYIYFDRDLINQLCKKIEEKNGKINLPMNIDLETLLFIVIFFMQYGLSVVEIYYFFQHVRS